jgi:hypothetical protein
VITRGRAQQFQELVEAPSARGARTPEYADLLEVVGALRAVPEPVADPRFVSALRDRLVAETETVLAAAAAARPSRPRRRRRRLAAVVAGVGLVGASATVAVASQGALPGDRLYSVKRGLESAHAELTFGRAAHGQVLLHSAGTRLDEAEQLSQEQADPVRVSDALDAFTEQAVDGSDLLVADYRATGHRSSITAVRTFAATSMARLRLLQSQVSPQSDDSLLQAARALQQVQQTAVQACSACAGPAIGSIPGVLAGATHGTVDDHQLALLKRHGMRSPASASGGPSLPGVRGGQQPPATVTAPDAPGAPTPSPPVEGLTHTVKHLTDGLTDGRKHDDGSAVSDTADKLLDTVGKVGDQVGSTLDDTVGGLPGLTGSLLP